MEDAAIISLHGKNENFIQTIDKREKTFLLLGGTDAGKVFYKEIAEYEMNEVKIHIWTNLSYAGECVRSGVLSDFQEEDFEGLTAVMVEIQFHLRRQDRIERTKSFYVEKYR